MPDDDVLVELTSPSGATWAFGESSVNRVAGAAGDFCLVVTQRAIWPTRHLRGGGSTDMLLGGPGDEDLDLVDVRNPRVAAATIGCRPVARGLFVS